MARPHPDITLEYLMKLIKGFVDILILASGYCSSGMATSWDEENIKKAIRWGIFFEKVFCYLSQSDDYEVLIKELDASLLELTSDSYFPQGLRRLSSGSLSRAKSLVLEFFSQTLSLSERHLHALVNTITEMDLGVESEKGFVENPDVSNFLGASVRSPCSPTKTPGMKTERQRASGCSGFVFQEFAERHASISCLSSCEASLGTLLELVVGKSFDGLELDFLQEQSCDAISLMDGENLPTFLLWNRWRKKNLAYLLNKRTLKLLSGSSLIFDAPKVQWAQILESLKSSSEAYDDCLLEIVELSLLCLVSSQWTRLIDHIMSFSFHFLSVREQYVSVLTFLQESPRDGHSAGKMMSSKEDDILEFCTALLATQPEKLWELPPVLVAAALPSWSSLLKSHVREITRELKGETGSPRCACSRDAEQQQKHVACELAERICCLYVFVDK
ncbi:unnamed protein product [Spirodela intermedia]|uniref:Uncharacterized protein n=1 Tax=Spirodela intermedia TaxID=51605 RepID=A0A7I8ID69_SPIIN|nr:unnamed protein product [Spirodela intermedia]CAA6655335.1 unnamed protein product [Spirodela intermedia]